MEETTWKEKTRKELVELIDKFLEISDGGGWAVKYKNKVISRLEDGTVLQYDENTYTGATVYIQFNFEKNLHKQKK